MTGSSPRIVVVGMSNVDHVWQVERFPPTASRTPARDYGRQGGGPAATAAVAAARLGARSELWSLHGDDEEGRQARAELERYQVDCSQLRDVAGRKTPVSAVLVSPDGERSIFPYRDPNLFTVAWHGNPAALAGAACLLCDSRYPKLSEGALREARALGIPTVGDWSDSGHWQLTAYVDHLIVSEECAAEIMGRDGPSDAEEGARAPARLRRFPGQVVGITLGERGFVYDDGSGSRHLPACRVDVVDTTGAGDVFHGSYAFAIAQGWDVERSGRFASAAAALSCRASGRGAIPARDAVEHLLAAD